MKTYFFLLFFTFTWGCNLNTNNVRKGDDYKESTPPPLSAKDQKLCDSLTNFAYGQLQKGEIIIVFKDTISDNVKYKRFVSILKNRFGFNYFRIYGAGPGIFYLPHKYCIQPIMDSAIIAKYGKNAKDSFVNLAYKMAIQK